MAKRVNVRFLTIVTVVVVATAVLLALSPWIYSRLLRHNPKHWIAAGDAAAAQGSWLEAANDYESARRLDRTNKAVCVQAGDAYYHLTSVDSQYLGQASVAWNRALEIDPQYVPALQRLLAMYRGIVEVSPQAVAVYANIRDTARRLVEIDPTDTDAKDAVDTATALQWLNGGSTSRQDLDRSLAALEAILHHDPSNAEVIYVVGRVRILQGVKALQAGDAETADNSAKLVRSMLDTALASKPNDPTLNLRAHQLYRQLAQAAHLTIDRTDAASSAADTIGNAIAHAKPTDAIYPEVIFAKVDWELRHGGSSDAESTLRAYNKQFPNDLRGRIFLANVLADRGKRAEAIALLTQPTPVSNETGARGQMSHSMEVSALFTLTGLQLDQCSETADPAQRAKMIAKIEPAIDHLKLATNGDPGTLRLIGALQTLKGERYEAMETLSNARHLLEAKPNRDERLYAQVLYQLGQAYSGEGQNTSAEKSFEDVTQVAPGFIPAHMALVRLYLQERNADAATRHVNAIAKIDPSYPELPRLRLALDQASQQSDKALSDYSKFPETTRADRLVKAQAAAVLNKLPEVSRLLRGALEEKPNDPQVSLALASTEQRLGQNDQAITTLQDQLKLSPNNGDVLLMLKRLQNASPAELAVIQATLNKSDDKSAHVMKQFGDDFNNQRYPDAEADLKAAERLGVDETLLAELYFQLDLARQQYDDAANVVSTLTRLNADDADGLTYQVRLALAQNHREEAIRIAQTLTGQRPELAMSWVILADAFRVNGQYDQALQSYNQALDRQAINADALAGKISCFVALNQLDSAAATIATARRLFPDNPQFRSLDMKYRLAYGDPEEVVADCQATVAARPDDQTGYLELVGACLQAANKRAAGSGENGPRPFLDKAHDALAQALAKWPNDQQFVPLMAEAQQRIGDFPGALKLLTDFSNLPQWKEKPEPQLYLADLYDRAGDTTATEAALRAAWDASDRKSIDIEIKLSAYLGQIGKFDDALTVLAANPNEPAVALQRLRVLMDSGRTADAETGLNAALVKSPDNTDVLYLLSVLYANSGRYQDAMVDVKHALDIDPKNAAVLLEEARIEATRPHGDLEAAERELASLLQSSPQDVDAHVLYADIYSKQHQVDAAIGELEAALQLTPMNKPLRSRLASLYAIADPPQWAQFDQLLHEAEANEHLGVDPTWLEIEASGLAKRNQMSDALAKMRQALAMAPDNVNIEHDYINMLLQATQYQDAVQEIDRMLANGKKLWWLHELKGTALVKEDQKQPALQEFEAALALADISGDRDVASSIISNISAQIGPDAALEVLQPRLASDPGWRLLAVTLYEAKGDFASALNAAEQVEGDPLATSTQRFRAIQAIASNGQREKQFDKAKTAYEAWLAEYPQDPVALNNFACMLNDDMNQPQEALRYSKQAYEIVSASGQAVSPMITDTQGWVLTRCGGSGAKLGLSMLQQLVDGNADFLDARYHLGQAYLGAGNPDAAMTQLAAAQDLIKGREANHVAVSDDLKKNIQQALDAAKQAAAKAQATAK